eukprot:TRINITY_DN5980_c0_g1_i2.p1 TRINITY_DN5980_c0_g1~~TRINITY_DN5980_c0_g1_i2.p1  ORF type:complete len:304 (+),score=79.03 TRINITY_DN5980_c0_g1_i2:698-1609(+)
MLNHRRGGAVFAPSPSGAVVLLSSADYAAGDEVWVDYGGGGPFAFLFHYGFVDAPLELRASTRLPWWTAVMQTSRDTDTSEELLAGLDGEELVLMLSELMPGDGSDWDLEVPGWFSVPIEIDPAATAKRCRSAPAFADCAHRVAMDTDSWRVPFRQSRRRGRPEVLPEPGGLAALRITYCCESEADSWYRPAEGLPIGPHSETAAAAAAAALRSRIRELAAALTAAVRMLGIEPSEEGEWAWSRQPGADLRERLLAIGAVLTCEMVLAQSALDCALAVPARFATVRSGAASTAGGWPWRHCAL